MTVKIRCGRSVGKSTGLNKTLAAALVGMLDAPQQTADQMADAYIHGMLNGRPTASYGPIKGSRGAKHSRSKYTPHSGVK